MQFQRQMRRLRLPLRDGLGYCRTIAAYFLVEGASFGNCLAERIRDRNMTAENCRKGAAELDVRLRAGRIVEMAFPDISKFPECHPGPYECQMGTVIGRLLLLFVGRVPDSESHSHVANLVATPTRWTAGHAVFDEVRRRLLAATTAKDAPRECQYYFEESCCQAVYNACNPDDEFDPSSAFFVVPQAFGFAGVVGISAAEVVAVLERA
jgi:hypothetical protein